MNVIIINNYSSSYIQCQDELEMKIKANDGNDDCEGDKDDDNDEDDNDEDHVDEDDGDDRNYDMLKIVCNYTFKQV